MDEAVTFGNVENCGSQLAKKDLKRLASVQRYKLSSGTLRAVYGLIYAVSTWRREGKQIVILYGLLPDWD